MPKMRLLVLIPSMLLAAACGGSSSSNPPATATNFTATMNGASEVPSTAATGTGTASFTVNGSSVNYTITYDGLSSAPASGHIHIGASDAAGGVVVAFTGLPTTTSGTITGSFTQADIKPQTTPVVINTLDDLLVQMRAGNTYSNIHTTANKGGEIRGQNRPR